MMATRAAVPMGMRRVFRRFERWRKSHTGRLPIPEHLWASAAELAREHGVFPYCQGSASRLRQAQADGGIGRSHGMLGHSPDILCGTGSTLGDRSVGMPYRVGRATRQNARPVERGHGA